MPRPTLGELVLALLLRGAATRACWVQRSCSLFVLACALVVGVLVGIESLQQGHAIVAGLWWFVAPIVVLGLFFLGLQRLVREPLRFAFEPVRTHPIHSDALIARRPRSGPTLRRARDSIP